MSNHGFRAILFYCVHVANVSDLFKESINLSVRFGDFFTGFGGGAIFMRSLIAVFWQNHYNVGFLWEGGGLEHQAGPFSPAVFRLSPLSRAEPRETNTLFSEQLLPSAALL